MIETRDINSTVIHQGENCHLWIGIRRSDFEAILSSGNRSVVIRGKADIRSPGRALSTVLRKFRSEGIHLTIPFGAVNYGTRRLVA